MGKLQNKKFRGKGKKGPDGEEIIESGDAVKPEGTTEQVKDESENGKTAGVVDAEVVSAKDADAEKDTTEAAKQDGQESGKPSTDGNQEKKVKTPKRRRKRGKKDKASVETKQGEKATPSTGVKSETDKKKKAFSGLIFMCNKATKQDCFQHRVFGLPEAKKDVVEKVTPGMKLFLFDLDQRLLYGVYEASSKGGLNLEPKAFRSSDKGFPAQVRFRIRKDSLPLSEDEFKPAIKDNYFGKNKFNIEVTPEQVKNLLQLFRPIAPNSKNSGAGIAPNSKNSGAGAGNAQWAPKVGRAPRVGSGRFERPAVKPGYKLDGIRDVRGRRDVPYYNDLRYPVTDYAPPSLPPYALGSGVSDFDLRRLDYSRDSGLVSADPYLLARAPLPDIPVDPGYGLFNSGLEIDPLYRQRLPIYSDATLRQPGKRPLDELYLDDYRTLPVPKRAHLHDELLYRDLEYQRAAPYADERVLSRYYAGAPW